MSASISLFNGQLLLNILLQLSLFSAMVLALLGLIRHRPALVYSIAWNSLIALGLLVSLSTLLQLSGRGLLPVTLTMPSLANPVELSALPLPDEAVPPFQAVEPIAPGLDIPAAEAGEGLISPGFVTRLAPGIGAIIPIFWLFWAAGLLLGLMRLIFAAHSLGVIQSSASAPTEYQSRRLHMLMKKLGVEPEAVSILVSEKVETPALVGLIKPSILLPVSVLEMANERQLLAILAHELAHWQRRDNIAKLIQSLLVTLLWFHPFIRRLDRIASRSREEICDNFALAHQDGISYSETLLWIGSLRDHRRHNARRTHSSLALGMVTESWKLEHRIRGLLSSRRQTTRSISRALAHGLRFTLFAAGAVLASLAIVPATEVAHAKSAQQDVDNADAPQEVQRPSRPPPRARSADTLGEEIMAAISGIQALMAPEDESVEADLETAKQRLDSLYESHFDTANSFEKSTILNFYTNYHLTVEDYPAALGTFEQIIAIDGLREDIRLRALRSLGQLYANQAQWQQSIEAFEDWRELSEEEDELVFRGLSYGHYQLERWQRARDYWEQYIQMIPEDDRSRDDYAYLNGLHFTLEDYEQALALTREMILRFNSEIDWANYSALVARMDDIADTDSLDLNAGTVLDFSGDEPEIAFARVIPFDGDYLPLVATPPQYPTSAADALIEGWVLIEFTVNGDGRVVEDSLTVADSEPPDVFDRSASRAASKFIFSPRIEAGEPVAVPGVQYLFRFQLRDDDA